MHIDGRQTEEARDDGEVSDFALTTYGDGKNPNKNRRKRTSLERERRLGWAGKKSTKQHHTDISRRRLKYRGMMLGKEVKGSGQREKNTGPRKPPEKQSSKDKKEEYTTRDEKVSRRKYLRCLILLRNQKAFELRLIIIAPDWRTVTN